MSDVSHCRLCAEVKSNQDLVEINKDSLTFNLDYKIYQCFQIQIELDDKLPKCVCSHCCEQVLRTHEFNEKIHKAQEVLKRIYIHLDNKEAVEWETENVEDPNNIEALVKIEEKEDYGDDFNSNNFEQTNNSDSDSDTKDNKPLTQLVPPLTIKTKKLKNKTKVKIKKSGIKKEPKNPKPKDPAKHRPKLKEWNDYVWRCNTCTNDFTSVEDLRNHYEIEHKQAPEYTCMICSKIYTKYHLFRQHVRDHINRYKHRCELCGKYFSNKWDLTQHNKTHSDIRKFTCATCGKSFKRRKALEVHGHVHLPVELKQVYECNICQKKYNSALGLSYHKQVHLDLKDAEAVCEQCGKAFKARGLLMVHMKTHVVGTPYSCDQCNKSFKWFQGLYKHKNSIHSEVIYSCDICGRKLRSKYTLNKHKLTHSSDYPHVCSYCNKGFKIKNGLTIHLRQHTGESPYACLECKHYFTNDSNFIKHLKGRHRLKNFSIANNHQYPFVNPVVQVVPPFVNPVVQPST